MTKTVTTPVPEVEEVVDPEQKRGKLYWYSILDEASSGVYKDWNVVL